VRNKKNKNRAQQSIVESSSLSSPPASVVPPPTTALPLLLLLLHSLLFTLHVNSGKQFTTGLCRFHRQPLLFLFSFFFVFYILHCSHEQWRAAHHRSSSFPSLATTLPFPLLLLLRFLHSPLFT